MAIGVWVRRSLPIPTKVFSSYWYLAAERQRIFRGRLRGLPEPLTEDPVLRRYKFTNAYRASDRTSQYLINEVIYDRPWSWHDLFLRILLFKIFNKIETWQLITQEVGEITLHSFQPRLLDVILTRAIRRGQPIYSAAYIMPPAAAFGSQYKHQNHLKMLERMFLTHVPEHVIEARSMEQAYETLRSVPSIGPFLAYQLVTDLNYSPFLDFSEREFVVPGPGALDGLKKCFLTLGDLSPSDVVRWTMETQEQQFASHDVNFFDLWKRPLQLIDCQNLYCEVDKYARVAHPDFLGRSGRKRIKQRYRPQDRRLSAWYPPKWGINGNVQRWLAATGLAGPRLLLWGRESH